MIQVIYLDPFVFGWSAKRIRALLLHEYLHVTGWTDDVLKIALCRAGPSPGTSCITTGGDATVVPLSKRRAASKPAPTHPIAGLA